MENKSVENNPVVRTAKWALSLMKNKIVVSLLMILTGIIFLVSPSGNMNGMVVTVSIVLICAAAVSMIFHLVPKGRTKLDFLFSAIDLLLIAFAIFCLISPSTVEPFLRTVIAIITILTNLVNLVGVLRMENKKSFAFFLGLFVALIMIGLGVAMLIAGEAKIAAMQQGIGIFLIINSVVNIWYIIRLGIRARRGGKTGSA